MEKICWHTVSLCVTDLIMEVTPQFFSGTYHSSFSSTQRHLYPLYSPLFKDPLNLCFIFDYCKQQLSLHYSEFFTCLKGCVTLRCWEQNIIYSNFASGHSYGLV